MLATWVSLHNTTQTSHYNTKNPLKTIQKLLRPVVISFSLAAFIELCVNVLNMIHSIEAILRNDGGIPELNYFRL